MCIQNSWRQCVDLKLLWTEQLSNRIWAQQGHYCKALYSGYGHCSNNCFFIPAEYVQLRTTYLPFCWNGSSLTGRISKFSFMNFVSCVLQEHDVSIKCAQHWHCIWRPAPGWVRGKAQYITPTNQWENSSFLYHSSCVGPETYSMKIQSGHNNWSKIGRHRSSHRLETPRKTTLEKFSSRVLVRTFLRQSARTLRNLIKLSNQWPQISCSSKNWHRLKMQIKSWFDTSSIQKRQRRDVERLSLRWWESHQSRPQQLPHVNHSDFLCHNVCLSCAKNNWTVFPKIVFCNAKRTEAKWTFHKAAQKERRSLRHSAQVGTQIQRPICSQEEHWYFFKQRYASEVMNGFPKITASFSVIHTLQRQEGYLRGLLERTHARLTGIRRPKAVSDCLTVVPIHCSYRAPKRLRIKATNNEELRRFYVMKVVLKWNRRISGSCCSASCPSYAMQCCGLGKTHKVPEQLGEWLLCWEGQ